jgi:hypothetical protein
MDDPRRLPVAPDEDNLSEPIGETASSQHHEDHRFAFTREAAPRKQHLDHESYEKRKKK